MNIFRITRFTPNGSLVMRNLQLTETEGSLTNTIEVPRIELPEFIEEKFLIPAKIVKEALGTLSDFQDTFD